MGMLHRMISLNCSKYVQLWVSGDICENSSSEGADESLLLPKNVLDVDFDYVRSFAVDKDLRGTLN